MPETFDEANATGTTNGTTAVTMVAVPGGANQRASVRAWTIKNPAANAKRTVTFLLDGTLHGQFDMDPGDYLEFDGNLVVTDADTNGLQVQLDAAPVVEMSWTVSYADTENA